MNFTQINPSTFNGTIPNGSELIIAESGNVEETVLVLMGFDEIGMFDSDFQNPVYGFLVV